jgi:hypothetical protein
MLIFDKLRTSLFGLLGGGGDETDRIQIHIVRNMFEKGIQETQFVMRHYPVKYSAY